MLGNAKLLIVEVLENIRYWFIMFQQDVNSRFIKVHFGNQLFFELWDFDRWKLDIFEAFDFLRSWGNSNNSVLGVNSDLMYLGFRDLTAETK